MDVSADPAAFLFRWLATGQTGRRRVSTPQLLVLALGSFFLLMISVLLIREFETVSSKALAIVGVLCGFAALIDAGLSRTRARGPLNMTMDEYNEINEVRDNASALIRSLHDAQPEGYISDRYFTLATQVIDRLTEIGAYETAEELALDLNDTSASTFYQQMHRPK